MCVVRSGRMRNILRINSRPAVSSVEMCCKRIHIVGRETCIALLGYEKLCSDTAVEISRANPRSDRRRRPAARRISRQRPSPPSSSSSVSPSLHSSPVPTPLRGSRPIRPGCDPSIRNTPSRKYNDDKTLTLSCQLLLQHRQFLGLFLTRVGYRRQLFVWHSREGLFLNHGWHSSAQVPPTGRPRHATAGRRAAPTRWRSRWPLPSLL